MAFAMAALSGQIFAQAQTVDFRYCPADWRSLICMPSDPVKTLVWKDGSLDNLDGLSMRPVPAGDAQWLAQELVSPRVPIVLTHKRAGDLDITEEAFVSSISADLKRAVSPFVQRMGIAHTVRDWANPSVPCEPAYRSAATGRHEVVHYRFRAAKSRTYTVVLGFCEGADNRPGDRILDIEIEGKRRRRLDLSAEFGRNHPVLIPMEARDEDGDGLVDIAVVPEEGCRDGWALLNVLWVFPGKPALNLDELLLGRSDADPLAHVACGDDPREQFNSPSVNVLEVHLRNAGSKPVPTRPEFVVNGPEAETEPNGDVRFGRWTATGSEPFATIRSKNASTTLGFAPVELQPGDERSVAVSLWRDASGKEVPRSMPQIAGIREEAENHWHGLKLPYDRIQIPDAGIQNLMEAGMRCIYQNRDLKNGVPTYQVGPAIYRDLSCVDGAFFCELGLFLDRPRDVGDTVDYFLTSQRENGRLWVYTDFWKENGLISWIMVRYAQLTGDQAWLAKRFPRLERMVAFIQELHRRSKSNPKAPNYGLIPDGYGDGGNGGVCAEYSNVFWCCAGLQAAVAGARMLGRTAEAERWRTEEEEMAGYLRKAMLRDARRDRYGNLYLPNVMNSDGNIPPPKGQYAFLQAVYPGKVLQAADPVVSGTLAMLDAAHVEGLPLGAGWRDDGVWPYFSHFEANAWQWIGHGEKSAPLLYAIANHAAPVLDWWEEQQIQSKGTAVSGDMPHNWGSVEFIRQLRLMLAIERGTELHLLEGMPSAWAKPGMSTRMKGVLTEFGPLTFSLRVSADGKSATLKLDVPSRVRPSRVLLHLDGWSGRSGTLELPTTGRVDREIMLAPPRG